MKDCGGSAGDGEGTGKADEGIGRAVWVGLGCEEDELVLLSFGGAYDNMRSSSAADP